MRTPEHHPRYGPHFRHDPGSNHIVDPAVVHVLRRALPDAEIRQGPAFQILGREDAGGRSLRAPVVLKDGLNLFAIESLPCSTGSVGGLHGRRRLQVNINAVILGPERRRDGQGKEKDYGNRTTPSHTLLTGRLRTCPAALTIWAKARGADTPLRSQSRQYASMALL